MVKLTPELIEQSAQFTNPVRDRELDLRGYKIPVIENMGATLDQFDTIDMSDNEIRRLDGFPLLRRLKHLLLNNNRITRIGENLQESLPALDTLVLTNNGIQELGDLDVLSSIKTLKTLSLLRNPVMTKKYYRLYVIHRLPHIRLLDFQKIKLKEREMAHKMFKGKKGRELAKEIGKKTNTFVVGAPVAAGAQAASAVPAPPMAATGKPMSRADVEAIKAAIANAKTLDEVERLNKLLQTGQVPGQAGATNGHQGDGESMEH